MRNLWFALIFIFTISSPLHAGLKPIVLDSTYKHDRFNTQPKDLYRQFRAYSVSFDSLDDDNEDGMGDAFRAPEWVAYEIKKYNNNCIPTGNRPSNWIHDSDLFSQGVMSKDDSYKYSSEWRKSHPDWYVRGHLCMKLIAERLGSDAAYNTHTFFNAVPQRSKFNSGIWLDLEELTAAWAQRFNSVWVVTGPIFVDAQPTAWIGEEEKSELPVAIPEALFKIVIKDSPGSDIPDVLAFIYPQIGPGYTEKPYNHKAFLVSVDEIESLTGVDFLTELPDEIEDYVERQKAGRLWPVSSGDFIGACRD